MRIRLGLAGTLRVVASSDTDAEFRVRQAAPGILPGIALEFSRSRQSPVQAVAGATCYDVDATGTVDVEAASLAEAVTGFALPAEAQPYIVTWGVTKAELA